MHENISRDRLNFELIFLELINDHRVPQWEQNKISNKNMVLI